MPEVVTMPGYFKENGYLSVGGGKIFHQQDPRSWDEYYPSLKEHTPEQYYPQPGKTVNMPRFKNMYGDFDWAPLDIPDEKTADYGTVSWAISQLQRKHDKPFFLACGIYRPHVPWYVPQKYFDMFPLEKIQLPKLLKGDLDDLGPRPREIARRAGNYHEHVLKADQWKQAVQGYLASTAYADAMFGRLIKALAESDYAKNTIIVVWSDHGWQLGEKEHWRKFALWENTVRNILFIDVPRGTPGLPDGSASGERCQRPVSLMDLYPTLVNLCGLPENKGLDGHSLVPLLKNPKAPWRYPAITTYDYSEFSIRTDDWRYTCYIDGSEELYDHRKDPEEWNNLAGKPQYKEQLQKMRAMVPENPAKVAKTSFKLAPHHIPPLTSREDYFRRKREAEKKQKE